MPRNFTISTPLPPSILIPHSAPSATGREWLFILCLAFGSCAGKPGPPVASLTGESLKYQGRLQLQIPYEDPPGFLLFKQTYTRSSKKMSTSHWPLPAEISEDLLLHSNYSPTRLKTWQLADIVFTHCAQPPPDRDDFRVRRKGALTQVRFSVVCSSGTLWWMTLTRNGTAPWQISTSEDKESKKHYFMYTVTGGAPPSSWYGMAMRE